MRAKIVSTEKWILTHSSVGKVPVAIRESPRCKIREEITAINPKHAKSTQRERTEPLCHLDQFTGGASSFHGILFIHPLAILALHPSTDTQHVQDDSEKVGEG